MTGSRIAGVFERARSEGRAAFIPYLTAGDPSASATIALARELDSAGADVLELGVPFSDPIADGPVLQRSSARALAAGTTLSDVWRIAEKIRAETSLALVLFSYLNPLLRPGLARAARDASAAGFDAVLVTDVPAEEGSSIQPVFRAANLDTVFLVSPTSTRSRMKGAATLSSGFLYVISRRGTTGVRESLPRDLAATVSRARRAAPRLPIAVGFGISTPETARAAARLADGVVVGSALVALAEESGSAEEVGRFARLLSRACGRSER
ncbi:MAG TPA: tryptophan synthase subunit alpha [Thermoanaerobaculia bacterium]|nr:tryptophan synthase subunit alpha [Thermoanaerobaculia bacterium]